ncbi:peptide methionine sulfoxide reductase [Enterococcus gallinarum]|nr:peptide-methionine (S)-S-oxide reductase MsrA [Enterococcus gallinarum]OJG47611.1 peptide methionine sulfoxide reductase [Enterococcus gallinarum]
MEQFKVLLAERMRRMDEERLSQLYNLIINPGTRDWERSQLLAARDRLESGQEQKMVLSELEAALRPLALRGNLTPDLQDFYDQLTGIETTQTTQKTKTHQITDWSHQETAIFAGGCFWCMVEPFEQKTGITSVLSGYTGGNIPHPTYDQVSSGLSGHVEAVEIIFDNRLITYEELVSLYWQLTDPTDAGGQFQDRGKQYRPIIFVGDPQQQVIAEASKEQLQRSGHYTKPIITEIRPATTFWPAENYHQGFYQKNPHRYRRIQRARKQLLAYQRIKRFFSGTR